ncbi:MAG TPA: TRAP transporter small permease [Rectinemataceae bacterium]
MRGGLSKLVGRMERVLTALTAVLMGILSVIVCWQVFARYVLQKSPIWVEEFSVTAIMWIGLLGAAGAVWTGDHMRLEFVAKRLPASFGLAVEILTDAAIGAFAIFLLQNGWALTQATWTSTMSTIHLPIGLTYLVLPVAALFMIFFSIIRIVDKVGEAKRKASASRQGAGGGEHAR